MKRLDYLNTRRGQANRFFRRHLQRFNFQFDAGALKTKSSPSRSENIRFQEELIEAMVVHKRRMFRGDVVLEMDFRIAQDNPPIIQNLPKYYIDLLENPQQELMDKCKNLLKNGKKLLLNNDRQVKLLIVNYYVDNGALKNASKVLTGPTGHPAKIRESQVSFTIDSMSNFYEDLSLLQKVRRDNFEDDKKYRPYGGYQDKFKIENEGDDPYEEDRYDDAIKGFKDMLTNKEAWLKRLSSEEIYNQWLLSSRKTAQEYYLKRRSVRLRQWEDVFSSVLNKKRPALFQQLMSRLNDNFRGFIFSKYLSIELPGTPVKDGETEIFKTKTRAALKAYYDKNAILNPLAHPISATVFLVPPKAGGKDLDNLALSVIPIIHEVLNPPSLDKTFGYFPSPATASNSSQNKTFGGIHQSMVTSYQIAEVPRLDADPDGGSVRIVFEDGLKLYEDVWHKTTDILQKWEEHVRREH